MRPGEKISQTHALTRREFIAGVVLLGAAGTAPRLEAALPAGSIDHVNIRVPDVQRSADFYIKLFGVEVARAPNAKAQTANPASPSGVLWFIRLGRSFLAISPLPAGEGPGLDHFSFGIAGFNGEVVKSQLAGLNQQWPGSPSNNLWLKDPAGRVIQLNAPGDLSRVSWSRGRRGSCRAARRYQAATCLSGNRNHPADGSRAAARAVSNLLSKPAGRAERAASEGEIPRWRGGVRAGTGLRRRLFPHRSRRFRSCHRSDEAQESRREGRRDAGQKRRLLPRSRRNPGSGRRGLGENAV